MSSTTYDDLNNIEETLIRSGTKFTLSYTCYEDDGVTPLTISGGSAVVVFSPFGNPTYTELQKSGVITGANTFTVTLTEADTLTLDGKYIQQPVLTNSGAEVFRPGQGIVQFSPAFPVS